MHYGTSRGQRTSNYQSHQGGIDVDSVMEMGRKERLLEVRPEADRERRLELKGINDDSRKTFICVFLSSVLRDPLISLYSHY